VRNLYLLLVFVCFALISAASVPFLYWIPKVLGCRTNDDPATFLAYCDVVDFADYENGAFYWNLEPDAIKSLQAARVLFLGKSRTQHAFSTRAIRQYFQARDTPYYIAGFGYGESMVLIERLIQKYRLHPDAVVINSEALFFGEEPKAILAAMIRPKTDLKYWQTFYNYLLKASFSRVARPLCNRISFICDQTIGAIWRDRETGAWDWQNTLLPKNYNSLPIQLSKREPPPDAADVRAIENSTKRFLGELRIPSKCVILTTIPNSYTDDEALAEDLGRRFHTPVVVPKIENVLTIDYNHLDQPSAGRTLFCATLLQHLIAA
jgi:hypothetical protein